MIHFRVLCYGYSLWNSNRAVFYTGDCTNERNWPHAELNSPLEYLILSESRPCCHCKAVTDLKSSSYNYNKQESYKIIEAENPQITLSFQWFSLEWFFNSHIDT